jgi:hypothetical protein
MFRAFYNVVYNLVFQKPFSLFEAFLRSSQCQVPPYLVSINVGSYLQYFRRRILTSFHVPLIKFSPQYNES